MGQLAQGMARGGSVGRVAGARSKRAPNIHKWWVRDRDTHHLWMFAPVGGGRGARPRPAPQARPNSTSTVPEAPEAFAGATARAASAAGGEGGMSCSRAGRVADGKR